MDTHDSYMNISISIPYHDGETNGFFL